MDQATFLTNVLESQKTRLVEQAPIRLMRNCHKQQRLFKLSPLIEPELMDHEMKEQGDNEVEIIDSDGEDDDEYLQSIPSNNLTQGALDLEKLIQERKKVKFNHEDERQRVVLNYNTSGSAGTSPNSQ
ncbi:hypothetical protein CU098_013587 [Rhizopus stolonifer]|uniref:Uncharacterized protein n=1 Tax=Rhizopus stolonifer TaxID=4846 RepID=A0A367KTC3_RHIST|nr:hypothetical protein CU098_013587 [Rhizopus stolonifer]